MAGTAVLLARSPLLRTKPHSHLLLRTKPPSHLLLRACNVKLRSTLTPPAPAAPELVKPPSPGNQFPGLFPLARLPTSALLRSLLLHSITSRAWLMALGTKVLLKSIDSIDKPLLAPLKWVVDKTFYAQFCAGSTPTEIQRTVASLRSLGFKGIILAYARETEASDTFSTNSQSGQIATWLDGTLKTIEYSAPGDYVAIKYTGAGEAVFPLLEQQKSVRENPQLAEALDRICGMAKEKGVRILVDAEQAKIQPGIHAWALELMRRYNTGDKATVYNTYQMYLKSSPSLLSHHFSLAKASNFILGVKLVRGAYLHSDPRHLLHDTKSDTDKAYDNAIRFLLTDSPELLSQVDRGKMDHALKPAQQTQAKKVDLVVASHNKCSVENALKLRRSLGKYPSAVGEMVYAQLMGMADELSLGLLELQEGATVREEKPDVFKYVVWGTTKECVKYLVRRAEENKDAVARSKDNRDAMVREVWRRVKALFGVA